jgi:hypothetical protein
LSKLFFSEGKKTGSLAYPHAPARRGGKAYRRRPAQKTTDKRSLLRVCCLDLPSIKTNRLTSNNICNTLLQARQALHSSQVCLLFGTRNSQFAKYKRTESIRELQDYRALRIIRYVQAVIT